MVSVPDDKIASTARRRSGSSGIKLIVGYKLIKALAEVLLGILLLSLGAAGMAEQLHAIAVNIRHHAAEAWSVALAEQLVSATRGRNVLVAELALLLDGGCSFVEGWALHRRYRWSSWLIVGATACFLPVEAIALTRHFSAARILLLLVNGLIVIYLVRCRAAVARHPA
jgi:uncharacterized membrane protein (DUF2068 family)